MGRNKGIHAVKKVLEVKVAILLIAGIAMASPHKPVNPYTSTNMQEISKPEVLPVIETEVCTVYVDDDYDYSTPGFGYDHFNNIQPAINTVCATCSGSKLVIINDGTYFRAWGFDNGLGNHDSTDTSAINIWCNNITLMGASGSKPIIKTAVDSATIFNPYSPPYVTGVRIINVDGDTVTIRNLYINGHTGTDSYFDGSYPDTFSLARSGILVLSSHNSITAQDIRIDSCVTGIGTYDHVTNMIVQNDTLIDCGVDGSLGSSIFLWGTGTRGTVTNNFVRSTALNSYFMPLGVMLHLGASGTVSYNTFKHMGYSVGVNDNETNCEVFGNTIDSTQIGIQILNMRDTVSIHDNVISVDSTGNRPPYDGIDLDGSAPGTNLYHPVYNNTLTTGEQNGNSNTWGILITDNFYWGKADTLKFDVYNNEISKFNYGVYAIAFNTSPSFFVDVDIHSNTIHDNYADGVFLADTGHNWWGDKSIAITNVMISQNSFYSNGELGIDLESYGEAAPGTTLNDTPYVTDPDEGPNTLYNFPVLTSAVNLGGGSWQLSGYAHPGDLVEIYEADGDLSGYGEGMTYKTSVTASPSGGFVAVVSGNLPFTALAIGPTTGNTSEFSLNITSPTGVSMDAANAGNISFRIIKNPVRNTALFQLKLSKQSKVSLKVYDVTGKLVRDLVETVLPMGTHEIKWDNTNRRGIRIPSGVYFVSVKVNNDYSLTKRFVITE